MKKTLQIGFVFVLIGMILTPARGFEVRSSAMTAEIGGTILWNYENHGTWPNDYNSVAVGDINGDGVDDAIAGNDDTSVHAFNGLTGEILWNFTTPTGAINSVAVGYFIPHLERENNVIAGSDDTNIYVISGKSMLLYWNYTTPTGAITSVAAGDFNRDGLDDVLAGSADMHVYALDCQYKYQLWNFSTPTGAINSVAVGDFNGDGRDDALASSQNGYVYAINGATGAQLWNSSYWVGDVAVGDFNSDGTDDALVGCNDGNLYALNGLTGEVLWTFAASSHQIDSVAVGDFNEDGTDDALTGSWNWNVYAINGATGEPLWTYTVSKSFAGYYIGQVAVGDFNGDGVDDALAAANTDIFAINGATGGMLWKFSECSSDSMAVGDFNADGVDDALTAQMYKVYAIAGAAPPMTKLEVQLSISKTYINITGDWTIARAVVTNVGAFPAYGVRVICHAPDGTDYTLIYEEITSSRSKTATWNLTSGAGLPTVKNPSSAEEISYTIAVEVIAANCPTELIEVAIIVDPPRGSPSNPLLFAGIIGGPLSTGVVVLAWYRKQRKNA